MAAVYSTYNGVTDFRDFPINGRLFGRMGGKPTTPKAGTPTGRMAARGSSVAWPVTRRSRLITGGGSVYNETQQHRGSRPFGRSSEMCVHEDEGNRNRFAAQAAGALDLCPCPEPVA